MFKKLPRGGQPAKGNNTSLSGCITTYRTDAALMDSLSVTLILLATLKPNANRYLALDRIRRLTGVCQCVCVCVRGRDSSRCELSRGATEKPSLPIRALKLLLQFLAKLTNGMLLRMGFLSDRSVDLCCILRFQCSYQLTGTEWILRNPRKERVHWIGLC